MSGDPFKMKHPAVWLAVALIFLSFLMIGYRIVGLGYPPLPTAPGKAWQISMNVHVMADSSEEVTVMIGLPHDHAERIVTEERITSGSLTFSLLHEGPNQIGVWSGPVGPEGKRISYRATLLVNAERPSRLQPPKLDSYPAGIEKAEQALARRLVARWSNLDPVARFHAVASGAAGIWGAPSPEESDIKAWKTLEETRGRVAAFLSLLRAAEEPNSSRSRGL